MAAILARRRGADNWRRGKIALIRSAIARVMSKTVLGANSAGSAAGGGGKT